MRDIVLDIVAAIGLLVVATGVALWSLPAGLVVLGIELVAVAYYLQKSMPRQAHSAERVD